MGKPAEAKPTAGLFYGLAAHGLWGLMPLYLWAMDNVSPVEILAHRIVWCSVFLAVLVVVFRRWGDLGRCLRTRRTLGLLSLSSLLIAGNWFLYIYGATTNQTVEASLGYFINPLFSVVLGMIFFRERLRLVQWLAVGLAVVGVLILIGMADELPWIAFSLMLTFGFYGLVRKITPVDAVIGLSVETLLLLPLACVCLIYWTNAGSGSFGQKGLATDALLLGMGVVTAVPLLCFGQAARRLPLTTLGMLQYIAPTLQFLLAVLVHGEPFPPIKAVSFGFIWTAVAIVSLESLVRAHRISALAALRLAEEPYTNT